MYQKDCINEKIDFKEGQLEGYIKKIVSRRRLYQGEDCVKKKIVPRRRLYQEEYCIKKRALRRRLI